MPQGMGTYGSKRGRPPKKKKDKKKSNPVAKKLRTPTYKPRVVKNKKTYNRKKTNAFSI